MVRKAPDVGDWSGLCELRRDVERSLASSCRDRSELDDLVQETLLRAARFRTTLQDGSRLRSWLLRIGWNVMRDHLRRERRARSNEVGEDELLEIEGREESPGAAPLFDPVAIGGREFDREDLLGLLRALVPELPESDRALLDAYYGRGLGCQGTALCLGISTQTIKMRLFRMRRRLRRELQRRAMLSLPSSRGQEAVA